jgi:Mn2+/Fe2+ NRAMP family transporter
MFIRDRMSAPPITVDARTSIGEAQALMRGFALVPLVLFTSRRDLMGTLVNRRGTTVVAASLTAVIIVLNVFLLYRVLTGG